MPEAVPVVDLYDDAERCAELAGLRYVQAEEPGLRRARAGSGFSYRKSNGRPVSAAVRARVQALVIPPAWQEVWICADEDGHLQATGIDDRGRKQYLYHERWREVRDRLNFDRLVDFGNDLPAVRSDVDSQLRRRTFDRALVTAAMLRIVDRCGLRAGSEVYAEENDSFGLSTLTKKHVSVTRDTVTFSFPAKSKRQALVVLEDAKVARVVRRLADQRGRRLFTVDGSPVTAEEINERLGELCGSHVTLKEFRTWRGSRVAFAHLRARLGEPDRSSCVVDAIDAAAEALGNTRAVARAHYVHPEILEAYLTSDLDTFLSRHRARATRYLGADENLMHRFLHDRVDRRA
ncbi:MAG TPA: DNA topoisomerase IB [Mycobacteriales bacterium]|nr:DNA topoisomerase IB [Mycobacteriales bacterium]